MIPLTRILKATRKASLWFLFLAGAAATWGCGGGGGGGGGGPGQPASPNALFYGTYHHQELSGSSGSGSVVAAAEWGTWQADGQGNATATITENENGVITGPTPTGQFQYDVKADHTFAISLAGNELASGWISADGSLAALCPMKSGNTPSVILLSRQEGSFGLDSLDGDYHYAGTTHPWWLGDFQDASFGDMTFDGQGTATYVEYFNGGGVVNGPYLGNTAPYGVAADGTMTLGYDASSFEITGGIRAGGDLVIAAGGTNTGEEPALFAMVRKSTAASAATLNGDYHLLAIQYDTPSKSFSSMRGKLSADGVNTLTLDVTWNVEGTILQPMVGQLTYTVASDGTFTTANGSGDGMRGGVSAGGDYAFLGGGSTPNTQPVFVFLFR